MKNVNEFPDTQYSIDKMNNNKLRIVPTTKKSSSTVSSQPDSLEKFFSGIADTMRTFSKHEIAKLKLQISTLVGQTEVMLSRPEPESIPMVYIPLSKNAVATADVSKQNIYDQSNDNCNVVASTVLIITKDEANEIVHDLTADD